MLKPLAPMIDYVIRYDYISQELCVNTDKPELHCNGKCYVGQEIAKNQQHNSNHQEVSKAPLIAEHFINENILTFNNFGFNDGSLLMVEHKDDLYFYNPHFSVFHPPLI